MVGSMRSRDLRCKCGYVSVGVVDGEYFGIEGCTTWVENPRSRASEGESERESEAGTEREPTFFCAAAGCAAPFLPFFFFEAVVTWAKGTGKPSISSSSSEASSALPSSSSSSVFVTAAFVFFFFFFFRFFLSCW
jgi:hypothetical protein